MKKRVVVGDQPLAIEDVVAVARFGARVELSSSAKRRIKTSRRLIEKIISNKEVAYGITTGFGPMCNRLIPEKKAPKLQENLVRSHCSGGGGMLPISAIRATMLCRLNTFAKGFAGIRLSTVETFIKLINQHVHPYIPHIGSVGASGDLVHLAHQALTIIGEGKVEYKGKIIPARLALKKAGIKPVKLSYKEGLALINGTSCMTGMGALAVHDAENILKTAQIGAAMVVEAMKGSTESFHEGLFAPNKSKRGQLLVAKNLRRLLGGSRLSTTAKQIRFDIQSQKGEEKVNKSDQDLQDGYSLRCAPQILGPIKDAIKHVREQVEGEMNAASDNPFIDGEKEIILHGGNFHGQSVGLAMDFLKIALTEIGILSDRRLARLLDEKYNNNLPAFLIQGEAGLQSGFMGIQYVPSALVAENRVLATSTSIMTVSTNAHNQDMVSMGTIAARQAAEIVKNVERILAVELICNAQGIEIRGKEKAGKASKAAHNVIRSVVPSLKDDRYLSDDIDNVIKLLHERKIVKAVEREIGELE